MGNKKKLKFLKNHNVNAENQGVNDKYPKFSFEFCFGHGRSVDKSEAEVKKAVFDKLITLSQQTWQDIKGLPREQGFEKIDKDSFKALRSVPVKFEDEDRLDVFRLPSKKGRLIGYVEEDTFFVVWIDTKFDMYNH